MIKLMWALMPVIFLLSAVGLLLGFGGSGLIAGWSWAVLLSASLVALAIGFFITRASDRHLLRGLKRSALQTLPAVPMLLLIGAVSATWMLSGVVPMLMDVGMQLINPRFFPVIACLVCAFISILTGSSWTTIATIGVAFMGLGEMFGYSLGWTAGAVISGAYFGDKISPLSDTTVLASSSAGVDLFSHIRYMLRTTLPSLLIALLVFMCVGLLSAAGNAEAGNPMTEALSRTFNLSPFIFIIPAVTLLLIGLRVNTLVTLGVSALSGLAGVFIFQPHLLPAIFPGYDGSVLSGANASLSMLLTSISPSTGSEALDNLVATGGMAGMLPTIGLVISAALFGGIMMGTGLLGIITERFTSLLKSRFSTVGATVGSGLFLNAATADQYLSLIISGNIYKNHYRRCGLEPRLLSRTLEDSVSVTSVLIPWNSCGITQSAVLGVATLTYLPFCIFNWLSPLMSLAFGLKKTKN